MKGFKKIDPNGKSLLMWGSLGSGDNQFCLMEHLALDKYDNVYVNDLLIRQRL